MIAKVSLEVGTSLGAQRVLCGAQHNTIKCQALARGPLKR